MVDVGISIKIMAWDTHGFNWSIQLIVDTSRATYHVLLALYYSILSIFIWYNQTDLAKTLDKLKTLHQRWTQRTRRFPQNVGFEGPMAWQLRWCQEHIQLFSDQSLANIATWWQGMVTYFFKKKPVITYIHRCRYDTYIYIHNYIYICMYMCLCMCMCMCLCIHIYIYMYIYVHIYIYTRILYLATIRVLRCSVLPMLWWVG